MKILNHFILNPFWLVNICTLHTWGAIGAAGISLVGGVLASRGQGGGAQQPGNVSDRELVQRGIAIRTQEAFPGIINARREFDPQFLGLNLRQARSAFTADDGIREQIESDIIPSQIRQRQALFGADVDQLRDVTPGLFGAQDIASQLQGQAQEGLALGRSLSPEEIRESQQAARSATGARGRGAGPFAVASEILGRNQFATQRESQRRQFAGQAAQLGVQVASPFLNIQAANRALVGSPGQQLGFNAQFGQAATPNIPVFDPNVVNIAQQNQQVQSGLAAQSSQQQSGLQNALLGGGLSSIGNIFGSFAGGGGFGGGGQSQQQVFDQQNQGFGSQSSSSLFAGLPTQFGS